MTRSETTKTSTNFFSIGHAAKNPRAVDNFWKRAFVMAYETKFIPRYVIFAVML